MITSMATEILQPISSLKPARDTAINLKGICCAFAVYMLIPNTKVFGKFQRIQQASSVMEGHFAAFVSVIILKITNDLPAAQGMSSRIRH